MIDLAKLSPAALSAAMRGGTDGWGKMASIERNVCYVEPLTNASMRRRKCHCGCGRRCTHGIFANGIIMGGGCELSMRREVKALASGGG